MFMHNFMKSSVLFYTRFLLFGSFAFLWVPLVASAAGKPVLELKFEAEGAGHVLSAVGEGVDGRGHALDNRQADMMGGNKQRPGKGGAAFVKGGSKLLSGASSLTICGWYRSVDGEIPANYARLLDSSRVNLFFDSINGQGLSFSVENKSFLSPDAAFRKPGRWIFFAVTFEGTQKEDNIVFYAGSLDEPVRKIASFTTDINRVREVNEQLPLVVGNVAAGDRPFKGLIDDVFIWADKGGNSAVLGLPELENIRRLSLP